MSLSPLEVASLSAPHILANRLTQGRFQMYPHVCHLGRLLAHALTTKDSRTIINMGPRWGKSELISYATPIWFLANNPSQRVIIGCNSNPLAEMYGGRVRNTLNHTPWLNVQVSDDSRAKGQWVTNQGGGMKAVGVEQGVYVFGPHLFIVDDPYATWADAQSHTTRKAVHEWFQGTVESRLEPGAKVIVLHHRLHPQDLTHSLTTGPDGDRWKVIALPSLALENDPMGRKPGESLCEARYSAMQLTAKRRSMQGMFEPMHQQNPMAMVAGGAYSHFGPHNLDNAVAFNPRLPMDISVDFNIVPGMHVELGQYDPITDEAWDFDEIHGPRMNINGACAELCRRIKDMPIKPSAIRVFGDAAGNARSVATSQTQYDTLLKGLEPTGIQLQLKYPNSNPPVVARVTTVNYSLRDIDGTIHYRIHPRCERLIRDLTNVQLDSKGGIDKSDPDLTHASDASGYRIHELRGFGGPSKLPQGQFIY